MAMSNNFKKKLRLFSCFAQEFFCLILVYQPVTVYCTTVKKGLIQAVFFNCKKIIFFGCNDKKGEEER